MGYRWQPDFVIKIGNQDVTKLSQSWEFNDVEEGISNITVVYVNKDFDVKTKVNDKLTLRFGYQGNLSERITMEVKEHTESYGKDGSTVTVTAYDCSERLTGVMAKGFRHDDDMKKFIESLGDGVEPKVKVEVDGSLQNPKMDEDFKIGAFNQRLIDLMKTYMKFLGNPKALGKIGKTGKAKGTKAIKKQAKGKKPKGFAGEVKEGIMSAQGPKTTEEVAKELLDLQKNELAQYSEQAAGETIRATITILGEPHFRAKQCIEVQNVGRASGKWYAKGVTHSWSVGHGYTTNADLLDADTGFVPIVSYAEVYKTDKMYVGPRKLDQAATHTFVFGRNDKRIIYFKWTERVQEARAAGEAASSQQIPIDAVKEERIEVGAPF